MAPVEYGAGDARAEALAQHVLTCLKATLEEAGRAACCYMWVRRERRLMPDACDASCPDGSGVAWVRLVERRFQASSTNPGFGGRPCGTGFAEEWELEVGVSRCFPSGEDGLDPAEETGVAADGAWDEDLIIQAVLCCEPLRRWGMVPVAVSTLGPDGGCVAAVGSFTVTPPPRKSLLGK